MECLYKGWSVSKRNRVLLIGIGCLYMGWGVRLEDGVFVYGMEWY